ncbi:MAG: PilZ domain-containing protein [Candidatus Aureabacteria bacterium]|nr:PilZ domain-containing protein [Candidatus Auribacterota bacterium]
MSIRVLLVAKEESTRKIYLEAIRQSGVQVDPISSLSELYDQLVRTPYNGILLDIMTKIKASKEDNILIEEVLSRFPILRLKWNPEHKKIHCLYFGQITEEMPLDRFLIKECGSFKARTIRASKRVNLNYNIFLSKEKNFSSPNLEKTITLNFSNNGCFIFSVSKWENYTPLWFVMRELNDNSPIQGEVRWHVEWGKNMKIPGIGVQIKKISQTQKDEINLRWGKILGCLQ